MAKQFIALEVGAISEVQAGLRLMPLPSDLNFTVEHIEVRCGAAAPGAATFNVRAGATLGSLSTIFAAPGDRPKILAGATSGEVAGLDIDLPLGGWLAWDADALPLGGLAAPVFILIRVEDGTAVAGPQGEQGDPGPAGDPGDPGADATVSRGDVVATTSSLADQAEATGTVALGKSFFLIRVAADRACRVRLYSTAAARAADAARAIGTDPSGEHGLISDHVLTAGNLIFDLSPQVLGANLEAVLSSAIPYAIQNRSGATHTVEVTFTRITLET